MTSTLEFSFKKAPVDAPFVGASKTYDNKVVCDHPPVRRVSVTRGTGEVMHEGDYCVDCARQVVSDVGRYNVPAWTVTQRLLEEVKIDGIGEEA